MSGADTIARARATSIEGEAHRRGLSLKRNGRYLIGPCPVCGGTDRFAINLTKQVFWCRGCAVGGGVIDLAMHVDGIAFPDAVALLAGDKLRQMAQLNAPDQLNGIVQLPPAETDASRAAKARKIWLHRQAITGSPAECYLRARGYNGSLPPTLGYLPARGEFPHAMIAAFGIPSEAEISIADADVRAVHITRLNPDGSDRERGKRAKIMIGLVKSSPIVLSPPNDLLGMAVTEGIEDGLSALQATGLGVWAAGSAGLMPALAVVVPEYIECVTIYAHDDGGKPDAIKLADELIDRDIEVRMEGISDEM